MSGRASESANEFFFKLLKIPIGVNENAISNANDHIHTQQHFF